MPDHLHNCEVEELLGVTTFPDVETCIVRGLLDRVTRAPDTIDPEIIGSIVARRQAGHWVSSGSIPEMQRKPRRAVYEALAVAAKFLALQNVHEAGFNFPDIAAMYRSYETELFRFDQLYRHFCVNAGVAAAQGWDILKLLREQIEACYCNGYLAKLALAWGKFVDAELPEQWTITGVSNQYQFFARARKAVAGGRRYSTGICSY